MNPKSQTTMLKSIHTKQMRQWGLGTTILKWSGSMLGWISKLLKEIIILFELILRLIFKGLKAILRLISTSVITFYKNEIVS